MGKGVEELRENSLKLPFASPPGMRPAGLQLCVPPHAVQPLTWASGAVMGQPWAVAVTYGKAHRSQAQLYLTTDT